MDEKPPRLSPSAREALMVWMKLLVLLAAVGLFGWTIMHLTQSLKK